ncbi:hypothetical protein [Kineococcus auxinigenes]|uniref:hypothetical protein n=1 Tax=unclassified Kineococcus TaxID=2621656 RepID=UPI003D7ED45B
MSRRPTGWHPLAATDPVPGDPVAVAETAKRVEAVARGLEEQAGALRHLARSSTAVAKTVDALEEKATDLSTRLTGAVERYRRTAAALGAYWPELEEAQSESARALQDARDAEERQRAAEAVAAAHATPAPAPADPADPVAADAHARAERERTSARSSAQRAAALAAGDLQTARERLAEAVELRDRAAARARTAIDEACDGDPLADSWWDDVQQAVHERAEDVSKWADLLGKVSAALGLLALAVGWIPVVGQALAAVLGLAALTLSVLTLLLHTALFVSGDGDWVDLAVDVVGLLTFGVGRAAALSLKAVGPTLSTAFTAARAGRAAQTAMAARVAREGGSVHGRLATGAPVDTARTALAMATDRLSTPARNALARAWGISGNAVDDVTARTRAAWRARDPDAATGLALANARLRPPSLREFLDVPGEAWRESADAVAKLRRGDLGAELGALTPAQVAGLFADSVVGASVHQTVLAGRAGAVELSGQVAATAARTVGLALDGAHQAAHDLTAADGQDPPWTVGGVTERTGQLVDAAVSR